MRPGPFHSWSNSFRVKVASVQTSTGTVGSARFRSGGHYHQGWFEGRWFITVQIPEAEEDPAGLRDAIREHLALYFSVR